MKIDLVTLKNKTINNFFNKNPFLLKNKNGLDYLIPEAINMDYFLFLTNNHAISVDQLLTELRRIDTILAAFVFDNQKHKSFQYLEFN